MALTADEAAQIAADAGLSIGDAAALRALADDIDSAARIAARFAESDEHRVTRFLFGQPEADDPVPATDPLAGNHVPREGSNPGGAPSDDAATSVRALFDHQQ